MTKRTRKVSKTNAKCLPKASAHYQGLCFRCEHRARFLEGKGRPRCECGDVAMQVCGCYMYLPCVPVILRKVNGDDRDVAAPILLRARSHGVGLPEVKYLVARVPEGEYVLLPSECRISETTKLVAGEVAR